MFNGQKITKLLEERHLTKKSLFEYMGTSGSGLDSIIKKCNPTAEKIEQIANFFQTSIDYFFDREDQNNTNIGHHVNGNGNKVVGDITLSECQKENQHLRELLAEKERTIQILINKK
jgi:putative prophage lsa1 DNA-binding protein, XRE family|nr:MAG TPA: helix-turn-helix domain protein [Caudoviricetes sp.]